MCVFKLSQNTPCTSLSSVHCHLFPVVGLEIKSGVGKIAPGVTTEPFMQKTVDFLRCINAGGVVSSSTKTGGLRELENQGQLQLEQLKCIILLSQEVISYLT